MKIYTQEEIDRIKKVEETNEKLEDFFNNKRKGWNDTIMPIFSIISKDISNPSNSKSLLEAQSDVLQHRQKIIEEIGIFLNKRSREASKVKRLKQDKFIFYATGFGIKTNLSEKGILIDGHLAENERSMNLIESYIDFLRDTLKNLESFGYSIKNMIELIGYVRN
jgi:threonine synthase